MQIAGLQKLTLIDYPGKLACTIFLFKCNFRCPWCYAPHLVLPEEIKKQLHLVKQFRQRRNSSFAGLNGAGITQKEFFQFLEERKGLIEGVVVCGGEPTISKGLIPFIKKVKKLGFFVKLDTNGSRPEVLKRLIDEKLVDHIAMDIKAPLGLNSKLSISNFQLNSNSKISKYEKATAVKIDLNKIKQSVEIIKNSGIDYEFRTTVVPGIHTKEDILQIVRDISPAKRYYLQNFRQEKTINPYFEKIKPYPQEFLLEIQKAISPFFESCQVR